jgi:hypothetical protein
MDGAQKPGPERQQAQIPIKVSDEMLGGVYANLLLVSHTREEFVLDFVSMFQGGGKLTARVITSPGHMKRIVRALQDNVGKYEANFGKIVESEEPPKPLVPLGGGSGEPN